MLSFTIACYDPIYGDMAYDGDGFHVLENDYENKRGKLEEDLLPVCL